MALIDIKVPDIGDFKDVAVIELLVKPGDRIAVDQSLVTVESDKASMEIPSSHAGVVAELLVGSATRSAKARRCCACSPRTPPPRRHRPQPLKTPFHTKTSQTPAQNGR